MAVGGSALAERRNRTRLAFAMLMLAGTCSTFAVVSCGSGSPENGAGGLFDGSISQSEAAPSPADGVSLDGGARDAASDSATVTFGSCPAPTAPASVKTIQFDPSFANGALATTAIGPGQLHPATVVAQSDGRIVVGGFDAANSAIFAARFTSAGVLDTTFGGGHGGIIVAPAASFGAMLALPSDKIVIVGNVSPLAGVVAQLNADGTFDSTFGKSGTVPISFSTSSAQRATNGTIYLAGNQQTLNPNEPALASLLADGSFNPTFGACGVALITNGPDLSPIAGFVLDPAGNFDLLGTQNKMEGEEGVSLATLRRITPALEFDPTFNGNGCVQTGLPFTSAFGEQSDGRLLVGVGAQLDRYDLSGALDPSFGTDGGASVAVAALFVGADDSILAVEDTSVSRLTAAGASDPGFANGGAASVPFDVVSATELADRSVAATGQDGNSRAVVGHLTAVGALDPSFGNAGATAFDFMGSSDHIDSIALALDGSVVAVGASSAASSTATIMARYSTSGVLDSTFGNQGIVTTNAIAAQHLIVDATGRLMLNGKSQGQIAVARFDSSGNLDSSFGNNGVISVPSSKTYPSDVGAFAIDAQGRYVVSTTTIADGIPIDLTRISADGAIDTTFGTNGTFAGPNGGVTAIAMQSDGNIVGAGWTGKVDDSLASVIRFTSDGALDPTFGVNGVAALPSQSGLYFADFAHAVALQSDGGIVVVGSAMTNAGSSWGPTNLFVARLLSDGTLDTSFGGAGQIFTAFGFDSASGSAVAIASDGTIWVSGTAGVNGTQRGFLAHFTSSGVLDPGSGVAILGTGLASSLSSAILQGDGQLLAGGSALVSPTGYDFALLRVAP